MKRTLTRRLVALALTGAVLTLGACGDDDTQQAEFDTTETGATDAKTGGDSKKPGNEEEKSDVIGVKMPDPDGVIAEATLPVPNNKDEEVRIGIESIIVTDQTMELRLVVTPLYDDGSDGPSVYDILQNGTGVIITTLVDRVNLKEYKVLRDGPTNYETDPRLASARKGETVGFQRFFAPPEDDIDVVDVKIHDAWPVFEDVPLTFED